MAGAAESRAEVIQFIRDSDTGGAEQNDFIEILLASLSPQVMDLMRVAQKEAKERRHGSVFPEHILLALCGDEDTSAWMRSVGVEPEAVIEEISYIIGRGFSSSTPPSLSPDGFAVLRAASEHHLVEGSGIEIEPGSVEPLDLLYGVSRESRTVCSVVLERRGLPYPELERLIYQQSEVPSGGN